MSGQLVGEVLDASDTLRARGLSARGFHALIAIADRASVHDRRASVPLSRICAALFGDRQQKQRTAERAISELKKAGVITVVHRGYNAGNGNAAAPVYEIAPLSVSVTSVGNGTDTSGGNGATDTDTSGGNVGTVPAKQGDRSRQNDDRSRQSYGVLNVFNNGFSNTLDAEPPRHCPAHPRAQQKCPACKQATANHKSWQRKVCPLCDSEGWLVGNDGTTLNVAKKCIDAGGHVLPAAVGRLCDQCSTALDPRNPATRCAECTFTRNHTTKESA